MSKYEGVIVKVQVPNWRGEHIDELKREFAARMPGATVEITDDSMVGAMPDANGEPKKSVIRLEVLAPLSLADSASAKAFPLSNPLFKEADEIVLQVSARHRL